MNLNLTVSGILRLTAGILNLVADALDKNQAL